MGTLENQCMQMESFTVSNSHILPYSYQLNPGIITLRTTTKVHDFLMWKQTALTCRWQEFNSRQTGVDYYPDLQFKFRFCNKN